MNILLTGTTGYIGNRLLIQLLAEGHFIFACVRDAGRFNSTEKDHPNLTLIEIDFLKVNQTKLPKDLDIAYYLIHSMSGTQHFLNLEAECAHNFVNLINQTDIKQTVYLSGIVNTDKLSQHLASRKKVAEILNMANAALTTLKAGIIIGSGSASFEIIRDLSEKLPVMITPTWVNTKTQPIAVRNVLQLLIKVISDSETYNNEYDIGGPDIYSFKEMMLKFAKARGLKRYIMTIPVMTPRLSSYWLYFVTSTSYMLAVNLVNSMKIPTVCKTNELVGKYNIQLIDYSTAIQLAFDKIAQNQVTSSWKDALESGAIDNSDINKHIHIPIHGCFKEFRKRKAKTIDRARIVNNIFSIGGENGWYYANWLWRLRGLIDKIVGGVGLNRGRKNQNELSAGDSLDFWRVVLANKEKGKLLLYAEMILPGEAWLEFNMSENNDKLEIEQIATFRPKGVNGRLYWWLTKPFHFIIFDGMINEIIKKH